MYLSAYIKDTVIYIDIVVLWEPPDKRSFLGIPTLKNKLSEAEEHIDDLDWGLRHLLIGGSNRHCVPQAVR